MSPNANNTPNRCFHFFTNNIPIQPNAIIGKVKVAKSNHLFAIPKKATSPSKVVVPIFAPRITPTA